VTLRHRCRASTSSVTPRGPSVSMLANIADTRAHGILPSSDADTGCVSAALRTPRQPHRRRQVCRSSIIFTVPCSGFVLDYSRRSHLFHQPTPLDTVVYQLNYINSLQCNRNKLHKVVRKQRLMFSLPESQ